MTFTEEFKFTGEQIFAKIKNLIKEGNIKRLIIKNKHGRVLLDTTVSIGAIGAGWLFLSAPILTTIAAIVMSIKEVHVEVEREKSADDHEIIS